MVFQIECNFYATVHVYAKICFEVNRGKCWTLLKKWYILNNSAFLKTKLSSTHFDYIIHVNCIVYMETNV